MSVTSKDIVPCDFINAIKKQRCASITAIDELRREAVQKGSRHDWSDANLLFPPTLLQKFLSNKQRLELILGCQCAICKCFSDGSSVAVNTTLINRLRHQNEDDLRRLFVALLFMGAGFIARHLCGIHTNGLDLGPQEADIQALFSRARQQDLWTKKRDPNADRLLAIFKDTRKIFQVPKFDLPDQDILVTKKFRGHENLPFLNEQPLGNQDRAHIWSFEIHSEYRGENVPEKLVRKELPAINAVETKVFEALKSLALPKKRHFINLEFSYNYHGQENHVFKKYPGSLEDIFRGEELSVKRPSPQNYRDSILHHWLWQGAMDIVDSLALFHSPEFFPRSDRGPITAAHFDIKPANVLADDDGYLVLADFGDTRIVKKGERFKTSGGDYNYGPPGPRNGTEVTWSQAYDVWSMACVLTEIIEYVWRRNGCEAIEDFREHRTADNENSHEAFWMPDNGDYKLRKSVKDILSEYKSHEDRYLRQVADLLEGMFAVQEFKRPSMVQCSQRLAMIFQNVSTDPYPQPCEGEILISDLGTKSPLRNMLTHVERMSKATVSREKCTMFMSLNESKGKLRLVLLTVGKSPQDGKPIPTQIDSSGL
ncbi:kinase-like protein [Hyaloscypha variabilis F]|uniref:Kinase-like protein n=1 Tax=Hyaloscypha variabilis (strain UAMH 11265 / GT02V1 / F) TaxID=1149755 RepID=A0A2J6RYJ0_HYAVF|nr:kinase-like protein [Hyaloscypha variabilis F]